MAKSEITGILIQTIDKLERAVYSKADSKTGGLNDVVFTDMKNRVEIIELRKAVPLKLDIARRTRSVDMVESFMLSAMRKKIT